MIDWRKFGGSIAQRESNIELFRIIAMLLIVAHHFVVNSGLTAATGPLYISGLNWRTAFLLILGAWGKIGINCFVLITGYFMCTAQISVAKFLKLFCELYFYKIVIALLFWCTGYEMVTIRNFANTFIPFHNISDGFTSCFLLYYLTIPFLNRLVTSINENEHKRLVILCLFIYTFFGTIPFFHVRMNYVSWFMVLHFIAAKIRFYPKPVFNKLNFWRNWLLIFLMLDIASILTCFVVGQKIGKNAPWFFVTDSNTLLALLTGLSAFMFFKLIHVKKSRYINLIATTTFGVLMIHANSDTMRHWLWHDMVNVVGHFSSPLLVPYAIGCVALIFGICSLIDLFRQYFIEPIYMKWCFKLLDTLGNNKLIEK